MWQLAHKRASCPRVIQVDMRCNNVRHILWIKTCFSNRRKQRLLHTTWARIDDSKLISTGKQIGTNNPMLTKERVRDLPCARAKLSNIRQGTLHYFLAEIALACVNNSK